MKKAVLQSHSDPGFWLAVFWDDYDHSLRTDYSSGTHYANHIQGGMFITSKDDIIDFIDALYALIEEDEP
jgi:hypothetical protein